ncbi:MAG TPA: UDP-2,3-diacylglucosamine diphosphatase, partial [Azonexus sp.]
MFLAFLAGRARQAEALYILGDLFEAWIGDDDLGDPFHAGIVAALRAAADSGLAISVMHGNRDFLLGAGFAAAAGVRLIDDPTVLSTAEWQFVLSHGDALCLDDAAYMAFRAQVR